MNENNEVDAGVRNHQALLVPRHCSDNQAAPCTTVKIDLMKEQNPKYGYSIIKGKNSTRVLCCNFGGERVERGIIQVAKVFHRASNHSIQGRNSYTQDICFWDSPEKGEEEFVVIKALRKSVIEFSLQHGGKENPYTELQCMQELGDNVHVLKCIEVLQDDNFLHIIMPYCSEGSLMDNIPCFCKAANFCSPGLAEEDAKKFFYQILKILQYLQDHGIYHRDISPGNFMFYKGHLVLIDFAMAERISIDASGRSCSISHQGRYGTFAFQAPEIFDPRCSFHGYAADLWSAAVVLYSMLTGKLMYYKPSPSDIGFRYCLLAGGLSRNPNNPLTEEIINDAFCNKNCTQSQEALRTCVHAITRISSDAMDLLEKMLEVRPASRLSLQQAMESPWLQNSQL